MVWSIARRLAQELSYGILPSWHIPRTVEKDGYHIYRVPPTISWGFPQIWGLGKVLFDASRACELDAGVACPELREFNFNPKADGSQDCQYGCDQFRTALSEQARAW